MPNDLSLPAPPMPGAISLRRKIHQVPELGNECPQTRAAILDAIADLDLDVHLSQSTGGVVAVLRGASPGKCILLRADMDALPILEETGLPFTSQLSGCMHACGHDAHTGMLAGAVRLLASRREQLAGTVVFMFQPIASILD